MTECDYCGRRERLPIHDWIFVAGDDYGPFCSVECKARHIREALP